ncbi:hypothetical protein ACIPRD_13215 [Streptomyces sp. NPDC090108]|uniref:hypothetical protein n=1 Tax=Streptomyces sp. NPDC090108 TaxID=3365947 RepID=UPI00382133A6
MERSRPSAHRRMLIESVVLVAAAPSVQMAWLHQAGVEPDEIALYFDDAFRLAERLVEDGQIGQGALALLRMIDEVFDGMTQDTGADRWSGEALSTDAGWERARELACEVLIVTRVEAHQEDTDPVEAGPDALSPAAWAVSEPGARKP